MYVKIIVDSRVQILPEELQEVLLDAYWLLKYCNSVSWLLYEGK